MACAAVSTAAPNSLLNGRAFRYAVSKPAFCTALLQKRIGASKQPAALQRATASSQALSSPDGTLSSDQQQQTAVRRRIVLAVDSTEASVAAFDWVLAKLLRPADELHLLHVVPDVFCGPSSGSIYYCSSPDPEAERMLWQQSQQLLEDNFLQRAKAQGLEDAVQLHLVDERRHKHVGQALCKMAEELEADPLVVASHDKGPLEELLLGSVSKYCATHSRRPVLVWHASHSDL